VDHALGVDNSTQFIRAARQLGRTHRARIRVRLEGDRNARRAVVLPRRLRSVRATFAVGDAQHLAPACRGPFHVVLAINLIDRLPRPRKFLAQLGELVVPGGQLVIASPYTWMEQFTPRREWLCRAGQSSSAALDSILGPSFRLVRRRHLPFLIREHARKYQWCVSEASTYVRRA
jgi:SAM-dependent methyltransferase